MGPAPLLALLGHLRVIEIDRDIIARLRLAYPPERLSVHAGDVLEFDFSTLPEGLRGGYTYRSSRRRVRH